VTARAGSAFKASQAGPTWSLNQFSTARSRAIGARSSSALARESLFYLRPHAPSARPKYHHDDLKIPNFDTYKGLLAIPPRIRQKPALLFFKPPMPPSHKPDESVAKLAAAHAAAQVDSEQPTRHRGYAVNQP
jgi:hypothetical protein